MFSSPISLTTAARLLSAAFLACIAGVVSAQAPVTQQLLHTSDANSTIHKLELIHLFQDEWPTGITVSSSGRMFANYPRSDPNNTAYTVAELMGNSTERAYPSVKFNMPASGIVETDAVSGTMVGSGDSGALISVQSVVLDPMDRLWILDTGRPVVNGTMVLSTPGGPKLVGVDIESNKVIKTITFPPTVAYPETYLNDIRFDLRPNLSDTSGSGVAYITDSSNEGRNGIIVVDLGTGNSWRKLDGHYSVRAESGFLPLIFSSPTYVHSTPQAPLSRSTTGSDGIAISADGEKLYYCPLSGRTLYSVDTAALRAQGFNSEILAEAAVKNLGQKGMSDGLETDSAGHIYISNLEQGAIQVFDPATGQILPFVQDERIQWPDTLSVTDQGFLIFTSNQYHLQPTYNGGQDLRQRPFGLFKVQTLGGAGRVKLM